MNAGVLLNRDEFSQNVEGSGGCPSTIALEGRRGGLRVARATRATSCGSAFGDEIQPRLGVSYQLREGKGDKAYANWGRYYNMDQKSSGRSLAPNRIFQTQTVFDLSGSVLSSGPLASTTGKMIDPDHQADLHRRDPGRVCDAVRAGRTASTCSSCRGRCTTSSRMCRRA